MRVSGRVGDAMRLAVALALTFLAPWYVDYIRGQDEVFRGLALVGYIALVGYLAFTWVRSK